MFLFSHLPQFGRFLAVSLTRTPALVQIHVDFSLDTSNETTQVVIRRFREFPFSPPGLKLPDVSRCFGRRHLKWLQRASV